MKGRIQKWGNSLAVRIPKVLADELGLEQNTVVVLDVDDGKLVLEAERLPRYELEELLAGVTSANIHNGIAHAQPLGRRAW